MLTTNLTASDETPSSDSSSPAENKIRSSSLASTHPRTGSPPNAIPQTLTDRLDHFISLIWKKIVHRHCNPNLLRHHKRLLESLRHSNEHIVLPSDKNLGPVIMERETYIRRALTDHLLNATNYRQLTYAEANEAVSTTHGLLK